MSIMSRRLRAIVTTLLLTTTFAFVTPAAESSPQSQQDKAIACKNLADKKNLTGADRRSFLKDCMNKADPK